MSTTARAHCSDCGWTSKTTTSEARAAHALRLHSCAKHRAYLAASARGRAREAAVDRTPKPCAHKVARHEHGTKAAYSLDRCRCLPCATANTAYEDVRRRQAAYGRWQPYIDATAAREHVARLRAAGMGLKTIAKRSGVPHGGLWKLIYGKPGYQPTRRIRPDTEARLLAVRADDRPDPDQLAAGALVDATGTRRRVQALVAIGWSQSEIARRLGMHPTNLGRTLTGARTTAATARAAHDLYDRLWDQAPPQDTHRRKISASRARNHAASEFVLADAMETLADRAFLDRFDVAHASPPCPLYSSITPKSTRDNHPDLVGPARDALRAWGGTYVIENVPGAPLDHPVLCCGKALGLPFIKRHRLFESNSFLMTPGCACDGGPAYGVYGDHGDKNPPRLHPDGFRRWGKARDAAHAREVMGIDWMSRWDDLADAIPPAYTEYIGAQLLDHLERAA